MATIGATVKTLIDWAKEQDPDGKPARIVELLSQTNEVLLDMQFREGNLPTGHRTTVRTGLPTVAWRLLNGGVTPSKSTSAQIDEQCGMLEAYSEVDVELAKLNGNEKGFRLNEASAFVEAMNQEMASTLFYGNSGLAPEEFTGLSIRYSSLSAANGQNIINAGGAGSDNCSIWLIVWGENTVHGIYPKGSQAGLQHRDLGEQTVVVGTGIGGAKMQAYLDHWQWKCGLALRDWRYAVRIANIDVSNLIANSSAADLLTLMIKALHRIPHLGAGRAAFYMNRTCAQMLDIQRLQALLGTTGPSARNGGSIGYDQVDGRWVPTFRGIPIRTTDALLETEAAVT
ncbi:MAG TPA: hypothetical protein VNI78_02235 [Vicinamibacterales bacterium]|nr:hypothetical protein [Vicinamibacterales bacterium]